MERHHKSGKCSGVAIGCAGCTTQKGPHVGQRGPWHPKKSICLI